MTHNSWREAPSCRTVNVTWKTCRASRPMPTSWRVTCAGDCRDLHALWPYARLTRASTGVEQSQSGLEAQLRTFFDLGLRNVLIAGAADSALLAHVARSGARHEIKIVVLDICDTPLELSRRFATQWALPVETMKQDLFNLDLAHRFDVVLMHGTLNFIAADGHAQVLRRLHRAMRPGGRLLLLFNTSRPPAADPAVESRAEYADFILSELRRLEHSAAGSRSRDARAAHRPGARAGMARWTVLRTRPGRIAGQGRGFQYPELRSDRHGAGQAGGRPSRPILETAFHSCCRADQ